MISEVKTIKIKDVVIGGKFPFALISGPCVIENRDLTLSIAGELRDICLDLDIPLIFKASYDKANRTSIQSFRGPGIDKGLEILSEVRERFNIPILTDVHSLGEVEKVKKCVDVIQIPAFLSRQTDLITAAAQTGSPMNVKKGQFLAPWDVKNIIEKALYFRNENVMITERGTLFGYNNLVVDMRSLAIMRQYGQPVIFDVTHSLQLPGGSGSCSGGQRDLIPHVARAAVAAGVDGLYAEVHPDPKSALCDGPVSLELKGLKELLFQLKGIDGLVKGGD